MRRTKISWVSSLSRVAWAAIICAIGSVSLGAVAFMQTQHISFITSLYWAMTTAATVGYGDVTPHDIAGQVISILVMITAIPSLAAVFSLITSEVLHRKNKKHLEEKFEHLERKLKGDL